MTQFLHRLLSNEKFFLILLVLAMMIWGGSWVSGKILATIVHPLTVSFYRFLIAFFAFIPTLVIFKQNIRIDGKSLLLTATGAVLITVYNLLFFAALSTGWPGAGGVLVTCIIPVFTFLFSLLFFKKKITVKHVIGLVLGVVGGLILLEIWNTSPDKLLASGNLLFIIAAVLFALLTIVSGEAQKRISIFVYSFYMYGIATVLSFFVALPFNLKTALKPNPVFWGNIFYLAVITSLCATPIYFFASKKLSANRASSFNLFVPFFAVLGSLLVLGEIPKVVTIVGGICAMFAIYLINSKTSSKGAIPELSADVSSGVDEKRPLSGR